MARQAILVLLANRPLARLAPLAWLR